VKQQFKENLFRIGVEEKPAATPSSELRSGQWPEFDRNLSAAFEVIGHTDGNFVVKITDGHRPNDVLRYFIDQGIGVNSFTEILPSLNDIFIKLVEGTPTARQFADQGSDGRQANH